MKKTLLLVLLSGWVSVSTAQHFQSTHLEKAAQMLQVDSTLLTQPGIHYTEATGQPIVLRTNTDSVVEHIGVPLFNQQLRLLLPSPIYDFLEYVTLDHKYQINENTLKQGDVHFIKGSWKLLEQLGDTLPCTIDNLDEKAYRVTWHQQGATVCAVQFPINYELLANSNRREMEQNFLRDLQNFNPPEQQQPLSIDTTQLKATEEKNIFVQEGSHYIIDDITDNIFLQRSKEGRYTLLASSHYPAESLANMLVAPGDHTNNAGIELNVSMSDYSTQKFTTSLYQFLAFCRQQGCQPFFGFEDINQGNVNGMLIMLNRTSGYMHLLHIKSPTGGQGNSQLLNAQLYLFTPTSNFKNLFADKTATSKSLIIWK